MPDNRAMPRVAAPLLALLLAAALAGCGAPAAEPTPSARPAQLPLPEQPTDPPASTAVSEGQGLPGRLLFVVGGDLWVWQGEQGRHLTNTGDALQPTWQPDGSRIVYVRRSQSASDLMLVDAGGGEPRPLTFYASGQPLGSLERVYESIWALYPAFSPDGQEIAFVSQYGPPYGSPASDYRLGLYTMPPVPGADRTGHYTDETGQVGRLTYTPDGSGILFGFSPDPPDAPRIYRYDRASGVASALPGVPEQSYDPAVSPDSQLLAYAARHAGGTDIFVLPHAGGQPIQVTRFGAARAPAFSPDGTQLAFLAAAAGDRGFDLWVAELHPAAGGPPAFGAPRRISLDMGIDPDSGLAWGR